MTDWQSPRPLPFTISTWSRYCPMATSNWPTGNLGGPSVITWPVANAAFYVPILLPFAFPVKRVFWMNGSSVTSTNMDVGIYSAEGTRLYSSTSTAASGASVPQYVTPSTDFVLGPGMYYLALADSSTTASRGGQGNTTLGVSVMRFGGILQENLGSLALPATMTPITVANACWPLIGITRTASGL